MQKALQNKRIDRQTKILQYNFSILNTMYQYQNGNLKK